MLRRALTYQLILAVAVGPLLCCCTAGKLLAGSPSAADSRTAALDRTPAERVSHACCSHRHAPAKSGSGQKSAPSKPGQPSDKCPCSEGTGKAQLTQLELTQTDLSTFLRALTFDAGVSIISPVVPELPLSGAAGLGDGRCPALAPSLTDELLYAHHNLRC